MLEEVHLIKEKIKEVSDYFFEKQNLKFNLTAEKEQLEKFKVLPDLYRDFLQLIDNVLLFGQNISLQIKSLQKVPEKKPFEIRARTESKKRKPTINFPKDLVAANFEVLNNNDFKTEPNNFDRLLISVLDLFPLMRTKTVNMINNKEFFESSLNLFWKLIQNPTDHIKYDEKQKYVGNPEILPFKYPKKGDLNKKVCSKNVFWGDKVTKFYCKHQETNEEIIGILEKIKESSKKQFQNVNDREYNYQEDNMPSPSMLAQIIKGNIQKRLQFYKIHFLATLIKEFISSEDFSPQLVNEKLDLKIELFERQQQREYLQSWQDGLI